MKILSKNIKKKNKTKPFHNPHLCKTD